MEFPHRTLLFLNLKWSHIAECLSQKCYESRIEFQRRIKEKKHLFSVPKSQNSNEEEKKINNSKSVS